MRGGKSGLDVEQRGMVTDILGLCPVVDFKGEFMNNSISCLANGLLNLGASNGMPKYVAFLGLLMATILFVPESVFVSLHIEALNLQKYSPAFVQYYISNSSFKNAMSVFWMIAPIVSVISTVLCIRHINVEGYQAYLHRRSNRLGKLGKFRDYSIIIGVIASVFLYLWGTALYQVEPKILGGFVPPNNRFAMLFFHGGALGLFIPFGLAVLVTEIRANFSVENMLKGVKK